MPKKQQISKNPNADIRKVLNTPKADDEIITVCDMLGANGAGKTTMIECILGTKKADSGKVSILGYNPRADRRRLFQKVGVQFQECDYQREIKVSELCEETACLYQHPADWKKL